jgi:putative protease
VLKETQRDSHGFRVTLKVAVHSGKPEIMSPAGYWPQLHAAIQAGADAVYFGLKLFTARAKVGFSLVELPEVMRTLHQRGVKGYVTFNTLVFEHELQEAARALTAIAEAGADAVIVQDLGILQLAGEIAPALELHASTQMSITSAEGVEFAQRFGAQRVTLARELSLEEIRAIRARTACELEMFVHGALCVAYSGQCFSSEAWGGRSANRGQCAQACRLPYELLVDGELQPLKDARYLLSPGDLYTLREIPQIVRLGVAALKIEGRYKDADYVALATQAYRKAVDEAWAGLPASPSPIEELRLEQVYSRGLGPYFVNGTNHQAVVQGRAPRHRGVCMGRVTAVTVDSVIVDPGSANHLAPLKPGDGLVFDAADWRSPEEPEEGGRAYHVVMRSDGNIELRFGNGEMNFHRIRAGDLVWRTHDPDLTKAMRVPARRQRVVVRAMANEGAPLVTEWRVVEHPEVHIVLTSARPLEAAQNRVLDGELLREQFGRLGNTPYELAGVDLEIHGRPFAPASVLNAIRRDAVAQLQELQARLPRVNICDPQAALERIIPVPSPAEPGPPQLHLLVRSPEQLESAVVLRPATITLDYLDLYGLRPSVESVKAAGIGARVAAPRVLKPGEERIVDFLLALDCEILVRSTGLLDMLRGKPHRLLTGDFSLNAANAVTADTLLRLGVTRLTPTHDLNAAQVAGLARSVGADRIEAIVYQHLPVFHTEHCVFCRFLSSGTSYRDCGRPCEKHRVSIRDVGGRSHPVMADVGCRNTVFGAEAQAASAHLENWRSEGIRHFRLEFVHESAEQVTRIASAFQSALAGRTTSQQLAQELRRTAPQGTTEGSLFIPKDYLTLPVLQ